MQSQNRFTQTFSIIKSNISKFAFYFGILTALNIASEAVNTYQTIFSIKIAANLALTFGIFYVTISLIHSTLNLLQNKNSNLAEDLSFISNKFSELLKTLLSYIGKFLLWAGIPLAVLIISIMVFSTCAITTAAVTMPDIFSLNKYCTELYYLAVFIAPIALIVFAILAIIIGTKLYFTWYSFADSTTAKDTNHIKNSETLTQNKKFTIFLFTLFVSMVFGIITMLPIYFLASLATSLIYDLILNSLGISLMTIFITTYFAQYYEELKIKI